MILNLTLHINNVIIPPIIFDLCVMIPIVQLDFPLIFFSCSMY